MSTVSHRRPESANVLNRYLATRAFVPVNTRVSSSSDAHDDNTKRPQSAADRLPHPPRPQSAQPFRSGVAVSENGGFESAASSLIAKNEAIEKLEKIWYEPVTQTQKQETAEIKRHWKNAKIDTLFTGIRSSLSARELALDSATMLQLQQQRRKAEADASVMRNRINSLRNKEEVGRREIQLAEHRLYKLDSIKKYKLEQKLMQERAQINQSERKTEQTKKRRQDAVGRKFALKQYQQELSNLKIAQSQQYQAERQQAREQRRFLLEATNAQKVEQMQMIRQHEKLVTARRQNVVKYSQAQLSEQKKLRQFLEGKRQQLAEEELRQMEAEEEVMLERLQLTQQHHMQIFTDLTQRLAPSVLTKAPGQKTHIG